MSKPVRPKDFVPAEDRLTVRITALLAIITLLAVFTAQEGSPLLYLAKIIPLPVALVALILPFAMYRGIHLGQEFIFRSQRLEEQRRNQCPNKGRLLLRARFKPADSGTTWEILNANNFGWTAARLLIERQHNGAQSTQKIELGDLESHRKREITCQLEDQVGARWRILAISREGQMVDFPDRWDDRDYQFSSLNEVMWN